MRRPDEQEMIKLLEDAGYLVGVSRIGSEWRCSLHIGNLRSTHYGTKESDAIWRAVVYAGLAK